MSEVKKQPSFHDTLNSKGYYCAEDFSDVVENALYKKPMSVTMLVGQAGTGKSYLPEKLGEVLGCNVYVKQAYQGMDWEEFVRQHIPDENTKSGIKSIDAELLRATIESKERQVILLLDEWDKTRISSDSFFLDFLQTGRISVSGQKHQANLDNLIIFFTSNNERDVSEPLLRRVKVIEVEHMPTALVEKMLRKEYKGNKTAEGMINSVLNLYSSSQVSDMDKPATVQELKDVINDWVRYVKNGKNPRWEDLVYINVTKNQRNHTALQQTMNKIKNGDMDDSSTYNKYLDTAFFDKEAEVESDKISNALGSMPRMMKLRDYDTMIDTDENKDNDVYVEIKRDDAMYTNSFLEARDNDVDITMPHFVAWSTVRSSVIERSKAYPLREIIEEWDKFKRLLNSDGTIVFNEPYADIEDVISFLDYQENNAYVRKATDTEIIFRVTDASSRQSRNHVNTIEFNARWISGKGCEFVVPTKALSLLKDSLSYIAWYPRGKDRISLLSMVSDLAGGYVDDANYIDIRTMGETKEYLNVCVSGENERNDRLPHHQLLFKSGTAKIKETKRTTTYDMGWAIVRSWHKKGYPNYKSEVIIKSRPPKDVEILHTKFVSKKLGMSIIPMFINLNVDYFDNQKSKWDSTTSTRVLHSNKEEGINVYCINTYDRTTYVATNEKGLSINELFDWYDAMKIVRRRSESKEVSV